MTEDEMRYGFGRNWAEFIEKNYSEEKVTAAGRHMLNFLKLEDLCGKSFLDIGCGSGLHSMAAYQAGAERIFSFDYDPESVRTTEYLRGQAGSPENWRVGHGDILDRKYVDSLEPADVVYSWGVLHHTGSMWEAIKNAGSKVADNGVFYIALYTTDVFINPAPEYWIKVKQRYNRAGASGKRIMEYIYLLRFNARQFITSPAALISFLRRPRGIQQPRGMSYWTDVKDWLGGWPMEFAGIKETKDFFRETLNMELLNINAGEANTEYLFRFRGKRNYWDDYTAGQKLIQLDGPFQHRGGNAWVAELKEHHALSDTMEFPRRSKLMLYENKTPVGFAHAMHDHIERYGNGRYSHWGDSLIFSATDNTDPNRNGRKYSISPDMM